MPKPDLCMFCNCSPCECNVRKKSTPRPRVTQKESLTETPEVPKQEAPSALESMRAASRRLPPKTPEPARPTYQKQSDDDRDLIKAIQVVNTLLGGTFVEEADTARFRSAIDAKPDVKTRAALWRIRREASGGSTG